MAKELKQIICEELRSRFTQLDGCVLIDHRGLDSEQTQDLRCTLREKGVQMNVVPNRLAVSSDATGTAAWAMIGPESTSGTTK